MLKSRSPITSPLAARKTHLKRPNKLAITPQYDAGHNGGHLMAVEEEDVATIEDSNNKQTTPSIGKWRAKLSGDKVAKGKRNMVFKRSGSQSTSPYSIRPHKRRLVSGDENNTTSPSCRIPVTVNDIHIHMD